MTRYGKGYKYQAWQCTYIHWQNQTKTTGIQGKKFKLEGREAETGKPVHLLHYLGSLTTTTSTLKP